MKKYGKLSLIAAISLDGKISDNSSGLPDWTSKEDWKLFQTLLSKSDLVISGRRTYEVAKIHMDKRNVLVLSTSKVKSDLENIRFINPEKSDIQAEISKYKNIAVVGGADVYNFFLTRELCTDLYLTIEPVFLGRGINLFGEKGFSRLKARLVSKRQINKQGTMLLHYKI